jgi:hypothetical protein
MTRDDDGIVDILGPYHVTPPGLVRAAIKLINPSQKYYAWCMPPSGRPMARLTSSSTIERFSRARPDQRRKEKAAPPHWSTRGARPTGRFR